MRLIQFETLRKPHLYLFHIVADFQTLTSKLFT